MKKLITMAVLAIAFAFMAVAGNVQLPRRDIYVITNDTSVITMSGIAPSNYVMVVSVDKDGLVSTGFEPIYGIYGDVTAKIVTTNVVLMSKVTTTWYEPCACPDGNPGCAVLHTRLVREVKYEPIELAAPDPEVPWTSNEGMFQYCHGKASNS